MIKGKKIIALSIVTMMSLTTLQACGKDDEKSGIDETSVSADNESNKDKKDKKKNKDEENVDESNEERDKSSEGSKQEKPKYIPLEKMKFDKDSDASQEEKDKAADVLNTFFNESPKDFDPAFETSRHEVEFFSGVPMFYDRNLPYDVRISLKELPEENKNVLLTEMQNRYGQGIHVTDYDNIDFEYKILYLASISEIRRSLVFLEGLQNVEINQENFYKNSKGDIIAPTNSIIYKTQDPEVNSPYDYPIIIKNNNGKYYIDTNSIINFHFGFEDPNASDENPVPLQLENEENANDINTDSFGNIIW